MSYGVGMSQTDFAAACAALAAEPGSLAWLDAGPAATSGASYLLIPAQEEHRLQASVAAGTVDEWRNGTHHQHPGDIFTALAQRWTPQTSAAPAPHSARFSGGWAGWFGYECAAHTLDLALVTEPAGYPDAAWFAVGAWARLDHATDRVEIAGTDSAARDRLSRAMDAGQRAAELPPERVASWRDDAEHYLRAIDRAQQHIADGEAYQLCLTSRVSGPEPFAHPWRAYLRLRQASPSHHGSFIRIGDTAVLSSSPEQFLEITPAGRIRSKPIKGTRPRSDDALRDAELARELRDSPKEQAENVMIVDLMRNDLARHAVTGSVRVPQLLEVESYAPVHQLVSTVDAQLAPGTHPIDAIRDAFPAGSMTGAPKHRAVQLLQQLESGPRGIYSGASGYLSNDGSVDLAMNIRCIVARPDGWSVGGGGGVTALSVPEEELAEARLKAQRLLAVLGVEQAD